MGEPGGAGGGVLFRVDRRIASCQIGRFLKIFVCDFLSQTNRLARACARYQYIVCAHMHIYAYMGARGILKNGDNFAVLYQYRKMLKNFEKTLYKNISKRYYMQAVMRQAAKMELWQNATKHYIL